MRNEKYSTAEILQGIRNGNHKVLSFIYENYFDSVRKMVIAKNGNEDLAHDVIQESLVIVYKKTKDEKFQIEKSSFFTYFLAVCRITLFNIYSSSSKDMLPHSVQLNEEDDDLASDLAEEEKLIVDGIKEQLFHKHIKNIPQTCVKVLQLVMAGLKSEDIAKKLNFASGTYVRKKKKICLDTLIEMIKKDPKSKDIL